MSDGLDEVSPSCDLLPGRKPHGPGWYLVSMANAYVEAGPYETEAEALLASLWADEQARGVNPQPYEPVYSHRGMIVGLRRRVGRERRKASA